MFSYSFFHSVNIFMYFIYIVLLIIILYTYYTSDIYSELRIIQNLVLVTVTGIFAFIYALGGIQWHLSEILEVPFRLKVMKALSLYPIR